MTKSSDVTVSTGPSKTSEQAKKRKMADVEELVWRRKSAGFSCYAMFPLPPLTGLLELVEEGAARRRMEESGQRVSW